MKLSEDYILDQMSRLLNIPSPTGDTKEAIAFVKKSFEDLNLETKITRKGALIATMKGKNDDEHRVIGAHVDTLGAMVTEVKPNGRLRMTMLGSYSWTAIEGEYVTISAENGKKYTGTVLFDNSSVHVHGAVVNETKRTAKNMEIRIDELVKTAEDTAKLGIRAGDFIYLEPRVEITKSGFVKSRHLDDKACVACLLGAAKYLRDNDITPEYTSHFYISNYEEVGHGSSSVVSERAVDFLAVDMAAIGQGLTSDEQKVTICAKDSTGPYDFEFRKELVQLCKNHNLNYEVDIYPSYGSDASAALRAGWPVRAALIGPGVDASHSYERLHKSSAFDTTRLISIYLQSK